MCSCISECFYRLIWAWISGKAADRVWLIAKGLGVGLIVVIVTVDVGLVLLPIGAIPTDNAGPLLSGGTGQSALTLDVKHYQAGAPVYDAADSDFEDAVAGAEPARDRVAPTTAIGARQRLPDLQANAKTREGTSHPDRNAQFEHINAEVKAFQTAGEPVISVDTKKKELVGDFKNGGRELRPEG